MIARQYLDAYDQARKSLATKDPELVAALGGASFDPAASLFTLVYCGMQVEVQYPSGTTKAYHPLANAADTPVGSTVPLTDPEQVLVLQYLAGASGLPLRGRWLSFLELPGGQLHYAPFQGEALRPLALTFGQDPASFLKAGRTLAGCRSDAGRPGLVIPAFPRIPLAILLWPGNEEFAARSAILFDASAVTHLSTASLYVLGIEVSKRLISCIPTRQPGPPVPRFRW